MDLRRISISTFAFAQKYGQTRESNMNKNILIALTVSALAALPLASIASSAKGIVFTQTNAASGNSILSFTRDGNGALEPLAQTPTGGNGTGSGLGNQ